MQARLETVRFPAFLFAIVFALVAALSLGAVLGYTLKPASEVIYVHGQPASSTTSSPTDGCMWIGGKKAC